MESMSYGGKNEPFIFLQKRKSILPLILEEKVGCDEHENSDHPENDEGFPRVGECGSFEKNPLERGDSVADRVDQGDRLEEIRHALDGRGHARERGEGNGHGEDRQHSLLKVFREDRVQETDADRGEKEIGRAHV